VISKLWSGKLKDYASSDNDDGREYVSLDRFNLFVGANNSGKSRFLRALYTAKEHEVSLAVDHLSSDFLSEILPIIEIISPGSIVQEVNGEFLCRAASGDVFPHSSLNTFFNKIRALAVNVANAQLNVTGPDAVKFNKIRHQANSSIDFLGAVDKFSSILMLPKRYYIPVLRGMRPLSLDSGTGDKGHGPDLLKARTVKDYFPDLGVSDLEDTIITGFELYHLFASFLLGAPEDRARVRDYERLLGREFFGGQEVTIIPEYGKDTVAVKIGEELQFPIYDLGDGLQQVIIITSSAYLESGESIYFIEEPEIFLHPGMLRRLSTFLLEHTKHQYVIATHSNHLLDLAEVRNDVSVFRVTKEKVEGETKHCVRGCTKDREILSDLGVQASSVYLSNSTVWVEGITDRLYLRCFLDKYIEELPSGVEKEKLQGLLENYHYTFIEYQGGTLGHWSFGEEEVDSGEDSGLCAIKACSYALVIADGDIVGKGERASILEEQLGDRVYILRCKEIENYLPENILRGTALRIFENMKNKTKVGLESSDINSILYSSYSISNEGIGFHIDRALGLEGKGNGVGVRRVFAAESGTVKEKVKFCKTAVSVMKEVRWSNTPELTELCKRIFQHVLDSNEM